MLVNVNGIYMMCMSVNKRVELAQRGIALQKMYVLLLLFLVNNYENQSRVARTLTILLLLLVNNYKNQTRVARTLTI